MGKQLDYTVRGSEGLWLRDGPPSNRARDAFHRDKSRACKVMTFSGDGALFAWCNGLCIQVADVSTNKVLFTLQKRKTSKMQFSPKGTYLMTWETYIVTEKGQQGNPNLEIWNARTGELVRSFIQKKHQNWAPQFSHDDTLCARNVTNEVQFFENGFETIIDKLHLDKLTHFSMSPWGPPYLVAAYVTGSKGSPSSVKLYRRPNFTTVIGNNSFYRADDVALLWNPKGKAVLLLLSMESTSDSYYGEQSLQFMGADGVSCRVPLGKNGPVYNAEWNPKMPEFCVVYGFMPAKITLYNLKCDPVFDFGTGAWNSIFYNPHGNILCLAGFGNIRGNTEFWDLKQKKQIIKSDASDITAFEWCPDGEHILLATTAPRLRVGNCFKVVHYTGTLVCEEATPVNEELWEVKWQSVPEGTFPVKPIQYKRVDSSVPQAPLPKKVEAYRPPQARGHASTFKLHENELPSNAKKDENLSKQALKNKKKREAKKAKQDQAQSDPMSPATSQPSQQATGGQPSRPQSSGQPARAPAGSSSHGQSARMGCTGDPEKDKKIRNLSKKLEQIEKLKQQQAEGKQLELNQLEKIKTVDQIRQEIEQIRLA
ncbi:eukaryotic translation initiation factor 2A-like isoform X2 [Lineus longissimus]|uniref:eukaryotic translation initiation factor 2A-like isoform X2 n=1 Tax=Lineus longissimus TaxID=88925 RepID=UPI002B4D9F9F